MGLGLCLGSLSLCLSRVLVLGLVLVLELELLPVALLSVLCYSPLPGPVLPLGLTVLTCLLLLCLFYALQCLPAVCQFTCRFARPLLPPFSLSFLLLLPLLLFHLTLTPCAGGIHIWMAACSVCRFVALSACRPSVYFGHPQSYFQFSQVIESTQILLV